MYNKSYSIHIHICVFLFCIYVHIYTHLLVYVLYVLHIKIYMQFHITKNHKRVVCVYMFNYQLTEFFHCASSFSNL